MRPNGTPKKTGGHPQEPRGTRKTRGAKPAIEKRTEQPQPEVSAPADGGYLIRIPRREDQERAIMALLWVPIPYCSTKEAEFLVTGKHIEALQRAGIPFEDLTGAPGQAARGTPALRSS